MVAGAATRVEHEDTLKPGIVAVALTIVMLTMPYSFGLSLFYALDEWWISVTALFWGLRFLSNTFPPLTIGIHLQLIYSLLVLGWLKLYYIYQMYKCYKGQVTKRRAVVTGIVSELQLLVWYVPALLESLGSPASQSIFIVAPIPVLLLCGQLILFMKPPPVLEWRKPRERLQTSDFIS